MNSFGFTYSVFELQNKDLIRTKVITVKYVIYQAVVIKPEKIGFKTRLKSIALWYWF